MTVLWFAPKPARNSCAITRTSGNRSCTAAAEPSSDALSSTTTSASAPRSDSRHASRRSRLFVLTIETATSRTQAQLPREPAGEQRLAGSVDAVGCLLVREPREQVIHSGVERDLRPETEQLLREPGVAVAMPDVPGAVLVGDLGLEVLAETPRDDLGDLEDRRRLAGADIEGVPVGPVMRQREGAATGDVPD